MTAGPRWSHCCALEDGPGVPGPESYSDGIASCINGIRLVIYVT